MSDDSKFESKVATIVKAYQRRDLMVLNDLNYKYAIFAEARLRLSSTSNTLRQLQVSTGINRFIQTDISRRTEQIAQTQAEELENINQLRHDFISTISHELRTPITTIKMCICMLEACLNQEEKLFAKNQKPNKEERKLAQYIQVLKDECEREISLINDLLELQQISKLEPLVLEAVQLQSWLCQQVKPFQERANNRRQILQLNVTPGLPPIISELYSIERLLAELLNNACQYTPVGEYITVTARAELGVILLIVSNSGIKISANDLPHIFEPFYRIPQADRWKQGGTGLGLAFVQKLVERLGGSIQVESAEAHTCFTVKLPQPVQIAAKVNSFAISSPRLPDLREVRGER